MEAFLDRIADRNSEQYLVIGVRPEGYVDFEAIRSKAELRKIMVGYEPLEPDLKVIVPEVQRRHELMPRASDQLLKRRRKRTAWTA